jgi:predicted enzyme related to lactoylglutathione lyase
MRNNPAHWFEIYVKGVKRAQAFYESVLHAVRWMKLAKRVNAAFREICTNCGNGINA